MNSHELSMALLWSIYGVSIKERLMYRTEIALHTAKQT